MTGNPIARIAYDSQALEAFYREHVDAVLRFMTRRVNDPHLAADLTADVFLAAIDASPSYRANRGTPRAWLFGVARNVAAAETRRFAREQRALARVHGRELLGDDDIERLQERIDAQRQVRSLYAVIAQLPEGERAVLELVAVDGLTVSEAAAALGIGAVAARVRLHRARTAVRAVPGALPVLTASPEAS